MLHNSDNHRFPHFICKNSLKQSILDREGSPESFQGCAFVELVNLTCADRIALEKPVLTSKMMNLKQQYCSCDLKTKAYIIAVIHLVKLHGCFVVGAFLYDRNLKKISVDLLALVLWRSFGILDAGSGSNCAYMKS